MNAAQIECNCVNANIAIVQRWLSKCGANFGGVHTASGKCSSRMSRLWTVLEYRGSWHVRSKFIRPIHDRKYYGSLLDAIPCDVKEENISNCYKSGIYFCRWQ